MHTLVQVLINQTGTAALYALVGVGFVTVYRATKVLNLAQGSLALLGGYLFYALAYVLNESGFGLVIAVLLSALLLGTVGYAVYYFLLRSLVGKDPILVLVLTLIFDMIISSIIQLIWGSQSVYPATPDWLRRAMPLGASYNITTLNLTLIIVAVVLIVAYALILKRARFGIHIQAVAENPALASYRGIHVTRVSGLAWAIGLGLAALAGVAYGLQAGLSPAEGTVLGFAAFPAIVLGGLDSVPGALVGGVILAYVQGIGVLYIGGSFGQVAGYLLVLIVLAIRPTGIFSRREVARL